jgi:hypothetical protein
VSYPPILAAVENYRGPQPFGVIGPLPASPGTNYQVNQQLPVCLAWSPKGLAAGYHLQIATNGAFSSPVIDVPSQASAFYVWSNAAPGKAYFYRVSTTNEGGTSAWANGAFQTVAPVNSLKITNLQQNHPSGWILQWSGNSTGVYVEFAPALAPLQWQSIGGPISGSSWTNLVPPASAGLYRLRMQ